MPKTNLFGISLAALGGVLAVTAGASLGIAADDPKVDISGISLPAGFQIELFATVPHARTMAVADDLQAVFVGTDEDKVYAVIDRNGDGRADDTVEVASGLKKPASVAYKDGRLYVVTQDSILAYGIDALGAGRKYRSETLKSGLPGSDAYAARYAAFGPDGRLYVSVGAPCNLCDAHGAEAAILRMNTDGTGEEVFASGVRGSTGMDFHVEESGQIAWYFTDEGVDNMGADLPPDELNHAWRAGLNFGFPWYAGAGVKTAEYQDKAPPADAQMPVLRFAAHSTPMGIHFYRGKKFPRPYRSGLFIAEHGAPESAKPVGARILFVYFNDDRPVSTHVFAQGWMRHNGPWGRPVDIKQLGDGSLLVSDDLAGAIYRITYAGS